MLECCPALTVIHCIKDCSSFKEARSPTWEKRYGAAIGKSRDLLIHSKTLGTTAHGSSWNHTSIHTTENEWGKGGGDNMLSLPSPCQSEKRGEVLSSS